MKHAADPAVQPRGVGTLARFVLDIFYRQVEVVGTERVPTSGAVVFVGNHNSALLDPALFVAYLPRTPRFLAKSTLWAMPILRPFLDLAAAIPVYRRQDVAEGADPSKNADSFAVCHQVLGSGGTIALFPEGISHSQPSLAALKTGVSRIVLEAMARFPDQAVAIVPVGLVFDDKTRFRSRVLVQIGEPLDPSAEAVLHVENEREGVRQLTERVRDALHGVTLNYPSWEEARLIDRAAQIWARPTTEAPGELPLSSSVPVRRLFAEGYSELLRRAPERVHAVAEEVRAYDHQLELYRLRDAQVAAAYPPRTVLRFVVKSLIVLGVRLPLGVLGTVLHAPTYHLVGAIAHRQAKTPDVESTYKVFASLIFYPLTWGLLASLAGWVAGAWAALSALVLGPISGLFAVRFHQRKDVFLDQARAFLLLRSGRRCIEALRVRRRHLVEAVGELVQLAGEDPAS